MGHEVLCESNIMGDMNVDVTGFQGVNRYFNVSTVTVSTVTFFYLYLTCIYLMQHEQALGDHALSSAFKELFVSMPYNRLPSLIIFELKCLVAFRYGVDIMRYGVDMVVLRC